MDLNKVNLSILSGPAARDFMDVFRLDAKVMNAVHDALEADGNPETIDVQKLAAGGIDADLIGRLVDKMLRFKAAHEHHYDGGFSSHDESIAMLATLEGLLRANAAGPAGGLKPIGEPPAFVKTAADQLNESHALNAVAFSTPGMGGPSLPADFAPLDRLMYQLSDQMIATDAWVPIYQTADETYILGDRSEWSLNGTRGGNAIELRQSGGKTEARILTGEAAEAVYEKKRSGE